MSSTLNILCAICNEFYNGNDSVYSTSCGHLFHHQCLFHWLARNPTCPQCRRHCHRHMTHRVYLNFSEHSAADDDEVQGSFKNIPWDHWLTLADLNHMDPSASQNSRSDYCYEGAIKAGTDKDGNEVYVARVYYENDLLPANYVPAKRGAFTPWNCAAHFLHTDTERLELLIDADSSYEWQGCANGNVPPNAIVTGYTELGENLYTGRGQYEGLAQLPGKVHPSHGVLYMPYEGLEVNVRDYEVLVRKPTPAVPAEQ